MPLIQSTVTIPASGVVPNVLAGTQYEYLQFNALVEIALNQTTGALGDLLGTVYSGTDVLMEEGVLAFKATMPTYPDDFNLTDEAAAGDRLTVRIRNTQAATRVLAFSVKLTPI